MHSITFSILVLSANVLFLNILGLAADELPVVLWNIKGDGLQVRPVSALARDDSIFADTLKDALDGDVNILFFAANKLSLEDFSSNENSASNNTLHNLQTFLDSQRYMFLSSVKDPMKHVHKVHCGVQEIVVDQSVDDNVLQSVADAFQRSCIVILHIADAGVVGIRDPKLEDIQRVFLPSFDKTPKKIVGVFTAMESSWGNANEEHHRFRNLLEAEESEQVEEGNFKNVTGCIIAYAENVTLIAANKTISLPMASATTDGSDCGESSGLLVLNFKPSEEFSSVVVRFNFTVKTGSWAAQVTVETTGGSSNVGGELLNKDMSAPVGFSYSCGKYELKTKKKATSAMQLTFDRFQVQPFGVKDKFGESFDCVTWFTIPIWMGIFVSLLFVTITNIGVYALWCVHTMDRFDDPKGKSITVAAAAD